MRMLAILIAGVLGLWLTLTDAAAPEAMHITQQKYWFQTVEQDGNMVNPTDCSWDADDLMAVAAEGYLEDSFQISTCVIADIDHLLGLDFRAPQSRPFTATVTMESATGTHTISWPSVKDGKYQRVKKCLLTPRYDSDFTGWEIINGGTGVPTSILWTMQLSGTRRANDAVMQTTLVVPHSGHQATYCGTFYTAPSTWPHCEGDPFVDGQVCYQ